MPHQKNNTPPSWFLSIKTYSLFHPGHGMYMDIPGGFPKAPVTAMKVKTISGGQSFYLEPWGKYFYIRNCLSQMYITAHIPAGTLAPPAHGFSVKQDVQFNGHDDLNKLNHRYQQWKFTPIDIAGETNLFIISNARFPNLILEPGIPGQNFAPLVLVNVPDIVTVSDVWRIREIVMT